MSNIARKVGTTLREKTKRLWNNLPKWLWTNFPLLLALLALVWILFATVIWPSENVRNFRSSFDLDNGRTLEVWGPQVVPLETPVEIHFALHRNDALGTPLTLRVSIPKDLVVFSPASNPLDGQVTLSFKGKSPEETLVIQVANAKQRTGLGVTYQTLQIEQGETEEQQSEPTFNKLASFPIKVEQTWRGVLRQGGGGAVPLGPLITLVTSIGTLFYQHITHSREEREHTKKAEKEKADEAQEKLQKIRQTLQESNAEEAARILEQIEQKGLTVYADANELSQARQLIELAKGKTTSFLLDSLPPTWTEAAAGAILYAAEHNPINRSALETLMRSFPLNQLSDERLKVRWNKVSANIGTNLPSQAHEWPRPTVGTWHAFVLPPAPDLKSNPFPADRAEEEETYLFAHPTSLFWSNHPTFQALKERRSTWIVGEAGSGKTALALAIGKYLLSDNDFAEKGFACYFRGLPPIAEIRRALARRLLDSLLQSPSHIPIGDAQNRLVAEVLLTALSSNLILGCMEQATSAVNWDWLKQAKNDTQRIIWQAEAHSRLRLLAETVRKCTSILPEPLWPKAWSATINFLGFEGCTRLAFDLDTFPASARQESGSLEELACWTEYGIHTLIFSLPQKRLERALEGWTGRLGLTWDKVELQTMAEWRWGQIYPKRPFDTLFANSETKTFFIHQAQNNPARLIRIWNRLFQSGIKIPVTQVQIDIAAKSS